MKRAMLIMIVVSCALLAAAQQQQPCQSVRATIPFAFQLNGVTMPAGEYDFCWSRNFSVEIKPMSNVQPSRYARASTIDAAVRPATAKLAFRQIGDRYFLAEIQQPGTALVTLVVSPEEKKYSRIAIKKVEVKGEEAGK